MDCGILASKACLLFISLLFWAAGASLAYVGSYVISSFKNFDDFRVDTFTVIPAAVIFGVAVIMFVIGLLGCCATLRESKVALGFFLFIIFLIFAAEIAAFVFAFIYRSKINNELSKSMNDVFEKYGESSETRAVDYLQSELECCGVHNYTDWSSRPWFSTHNNSVPLSCCKEKNSTCTGQFNHPELLNIDGCSPRLEKLLQSVLTYAMLVMLGFVIIEILGMLSICAIACRSSRNDYEPLYA